MIHSLILQEAVESKSGVDAAITYIKTLMGTCKLTKFRSAESCAKFYSAFFMCTLEDDMHPTAEEWGAIYSALLSEKKFCDDLAIYIAMYQPAIYDGIFTPLWALIQSEYLGMKKNRIQYLSMCKATITMIQTRLAGIGNVVRTQVISTSVTKFITVIDQALNQVIGNINQLVHTEIAKTADPNAISYAVGPASELSETARELVDLLESADTWLANREAQLLSEGIINNAKEKAKEALVAKKKAENEFDEFVMKKVKKMREERRNRKHSEMVGESLRINNIIKRLLKTGAIGILSPAWAAIYFIISVVYDRATDKRDREVLVGQLKDELEIVEEKIQMAERNGDEKARIELIRFRQKLVREYERIQRMRWDAQTRGRTNN